MHLTQRATELGVDGILSVTPYYNRPTPRGILAHFGEVAKATDRPIVLYNIPSRTGTDMPNDLLAELAQLDGVSAVKQANNDNLALVDGLELYAGNDESVARALDMGGVGGICVATHLLGPLFRALVDEPGRRAEVQAELSGYLPALNRANPVSIKAAIELAGLAPGNLRLPLVEATESEREEIRAVLEPRGRAGSGTPLTGTLRVLPLGGLGEIGKNMTVLEYEDRIVLVDCGLRFPTADMLGIDLVLPDFAYLRERADDIEGIVITHGHEDHLGALPFVLRELKALDIPVFGRPLTTAMARSKLDEHKLQEVEVIDVQPGERIEAGPFDIELIHMTHSIPDACAVAATCDVGTVLFTGDYKFDQTPVDGRPADMSRLAELGRSGVLVLCGDSTNADRPGYSPSEKNVGPQLYRVFERCEGRIVVTSFASNVHRVQQVIDAAVALGRKVCLVGRSMRKNVNIARSLNIARIPDGLLIAPRELDNWPDEKLVVISTGSQGEPLSALRRMAHRDHPAVELREGDTVVFSATPIPGNERAVNETIDRLYHIGCNVITTRDEPIHASGHGYAEEIKLMLNLTRPKYVFPFHGDYKRIHLHAELAMAVGIPDERIFRGENGLPLDLTADGAAFGPKQQSGMIFVDGVDIGDPADVALRDRRMLSGDGIFVVVATISEENGASVAEPEVIMRGVPFQVEADALLEEIRRTVDQSLEKAAREEVREIDLLQEMLHDDIAAFVYERLRRRPMVLPVVVAV